MNNEIKGEKITLDWGHKYGRPFGFREAKAAFAKVEEGKWELVSQNSWKTVGRNGGLQHGQEASFRVIE